MNDDGLKLLYQVCSFVGHGSGFVAIVCAWCDTRGAWTTKMVRGERTAAYVGTARYGGFTVAMVACVLIGG